jgi:hypothetical protein
MFMIALLFAACAPPPYDGSLSDTGATGEGRGIEITWPPSETSVTNCSFIVTEMHGVDFAPVAMPGNDPVDGQGHYHLLWGTGYTPCDRPYCLISFKQSAAVQVTAQLVQNNHSAYEDEQGDLYEDTLLLNVTVDGTDTCDLGSPNVVYGTDTDTGGDDTGGDDTGGADTGDTSG